MANIGTFTTLDDGFTGTLHTLTLKAKIAFVPNDKSTANAPDYRILSSGGVEIGAAWKKLSQNDRPFPATVYARLLEESEGSHVLMWSRSKTE